MKLRLAALFALTLAAGGCLSVLPEPEIPQSLFALPADQAVAPAAPLRADVAVYPPDSSRAFAGLDIAVRTGYEMVYLGNVRWVDAAPRLLQIAVVDSLSAAPGSTGRAVTVQQGARVDYDVRWRIVDLSVSKEAGPVNVEVLVSLLDSTTRRMVAQATIKQSGSPADRTPAARARALSIAARSVADQVAAFVTQNAAPRTPAGTAPASTN